MFPSNPRRLWPHFLCVMLFLFESVLAVVHGSLLRVLRVQLHFQVFPLFSWLLDSLGSFSFPFLGRLGLFRFFFFPFCAVLFTTPFLSFQDGQFFLGRAFPPDSACFILLFFFWIPQDRTFLLSWDKRAFLFPFLYYLVR